MDSIVFNLKAKIGRILLESFFKKLGKKLGTSIQTHHGITDIVWADIDTGKTETLLLVHGFSDRKENFYFSSKILKKEFNLIIPDLPGFGNSTMDRQLDYSLENYGDWLGEFVQQRISGKFHLAGCSLGGAIATLLAVKFPERVKSLSLVGTAGFYLPGKKSIYDEALDGRNIFQVNTIEEYDKLQDRVFKNKPVLPAFIKEYMIKHAMDNKDWYGKIFNDLGDISAVKQGKKSLEEISFNPLCRQINMPAMLFWGQNDTLFPYETAAFLAGRMPDARIHIFNNMGHAPHLEAPDKFAEELSDFIKSVL